MRPLSALRRFANTILTVNVYYEGSIYPAISYPKLIKADVASCLFMLM